MAAVCQGCGAEWDEAELDDIKNLSMRTGPGDLAMPIGQCPDEECGALCHDEEDNKRVEKDAEAHKLAGLVADYFIADGGDIPPEIRRCLTLLELL